MNAKQFELFIIAQKEVYKLHQEILEVIKELLQKVSSLEKSLKTLTSDQEILDPRYKRSLIDYPNFNWSSIEAEVIDRDQIGVSLVGYKNKIYRRETLLENEQVQSIIFSRNEVGEWQILITFEVLQPGTNGNFKNVRLSE